ncbi:MAG: cytochrome c3 family protein [Thermoleophilia bacterium]
MRFKLSFRKKVVAISMLAAFMTFAIGLSAILASSAPPASPHYSYSECASCHSDKIDYHGNASSHQYSECISCHGDRTDEQSLYDAAFGQYFDGPHKVHLTSDQLSFTCTQCHESVDIREESAASVRKQVSMECSKCHSPFPTSMRPEWASQDCTACHTDWQSRHSSDPSINTANIGAADCIGCHGGRSWYLTGAASASLARSNVYWGSFADYSARKLSVDFSIANAGPGTANGMTVSHALSTNGVGVTTPLPLVLGDLSQDGSTNFTLVYSVPTDTWSFRTSLYANAMNDDDEMQYWPSPPPSP